MVQLEGQTLPNMYVIKSMHLKVLNEKSQTAQ